MIGGFEEAFAVGADLRYAVQCLEELVVDLLRLQRADVLFG